MHLASMTHMHLTTENQAAIAGKVLTLVLAAVHCIDVNIRYDAAAMRHDSNSDMA